MGFMMQIRPEVLKKLREDYPTRVPCGACPDV